ncbi:Polysaccharide deacetylase [Dyella jiangningensis]|uniref:polysaccharide deacetylase family protein n=1 Tax=Dyella sp. AtDHG13 TaxID=1938897 RepID=UPI000885E85C|nr:polysaccharide deacetylase family protein [Dyella sp. AtDHG13]PXV61433.1 polysaccharide deacetylase [Dyella sp. AtDHG13]SDJ90197.1 Polysaccharide deacetylase [Dyella jiangningensis]
MVSPTQHTGIREKLGALCYNAGLLHPLQKVRAWWQKDLRILAYHRVMPVPDPDQYAFDMELISTTPEEFREQMLLVRERYRPMRLSDVAAAINAGQPLPPDALVVTFDDGYDDNYRIAYPILKELGVPATFFISTGHIDSGRPYAYDWLVHMILMSTAPRLDLPELDINVPMPATRAERRAMAGCVLDGMKEISALAQAAMIHRLEDEWQMPSEHARPADCRPMSWDQLREMRAAGLEIGSHGVNHWMLSKLPREELEREVFDSRNALLRELGPMPLLMSYPVGSNRAFDRQVIEVTRDAGFDLACSYISGTNPHPADNRYALYRIAVERYYGKAWFAALLAMPGLVGYPTPAHLASTDDAPCSH